MIAQKQCLPLYLFGNHPKAIGRLRNQSANSNFSKTMSYLKLLQSRGLVEELSKLRVSSRSACGWKEAKSQLLQISEIVKLIFSRVKGTPQCANATSGSVLDVWKRRTWGDRVTTEASCTLSCVDQKGRRGESRIHQTGNPLPPLWGS